MRIEKSKFMSCEIYNKEVYTKAATHNAQYTQMKKVGAKSPKRLCISLIQAIHIRIFLRRNFMLRNFAISIVEIDFSPFLTALSNKP